VFRSGSSMQPVATLTYEGHDVFRTASSRQPAGSHNLIYLRGAFCSHEGVVRPKGHIGTLEVRSSEAGAGVEVVSWAI
jgi:hypothetical protein